MMVRSRRHGQSSGQAHGGMSGCETSSADAPTPLVANRDAGFFVSPLRRRLSEEQVKRAWRRAAK